MDSIWVVRLDAPGDGPRLAVKDCVDVEGLPTTAGCQAIAEQARPADRDAPVVATARRAGARIVGKTSLTELCWSASGINPWLGTPPNPLDARRIPGGSSSGSAVAVATGEADVALGTDTGGSVRIPAACCGIAGLKTTWGRIPLDGVYPLAASMDTVGPLGADVAAVELGMGLIDPGFPGASAEVPARVGRIRTAPDVGVDPATDAAVDAVLAAAGPAGLEVADVPGFDFRAVNRAGNVAIDVEAYPANAHLLPRLDQLTPGIRHNLEEAAGITAEAAADANRVRQDLRDWFSAALARHPVLALPGLIGAPPLLGERMSTTILTMPANLAGLPALVLPVPGGSAGLPASLQLIGPPGGEEQLLALGHVIEAALPR
ncbi:MAG TPA: amidase [Streptosporangiaceae bacterium]|nr:amidase [Streptosporangiaceae bacterium]